MSFDTKRRIMKMKTLLTHLKVLFIIKAQGVRNWNGSRKKYKKVGQIVPKIYSLRDAKCSRNERLSSQYGATKISIFYEILGII